MVWVSPLIHLAPYPLLGAYKTYSYQRTMYSLLTPYIQSLRMNLLAGSQQRRSLCAVTKSEDLVGS
jgi:hypothetical protein